jgi:hypothetical protein
LIIRLLDDGILRVKWGWPPITTKLYVILLYMRHNGMSLPKMIGVLTNDRVGIIIECAHLEVKVVFRV